jgi:hypothetical protein
MASGQKNIRNRLKAIGLGIISGFIVCELILRIYNPIPASIKKGKLILPANQQKIFTNKWIQKLDSKIHYSRNSMGLRGPEMPKDKSDLITIITVGGSTTECKYLSDSCTWSSRLYIKLHQQNPAVWLNNAGIDGHTTFGHLLLVKEYMLKMRPRFLLLMTGVNDVELDAPDEFDKSTGREINTGSVKSFLKSLVKQTELGQSFLHYYQLQVSYKKGLVHREIDLANLVENPLADSVISMRIKKQLPYLAAYQQRIDSIISMCVKNGITPVLITQPSLYGSYSDPFTGIAVGNKWSEKNPAGENLLLMEKVLESYNDVLRSFSEKITVIDLARLMPKNSAYFYDFTHVTNSGAVKVADVLFSELSELINSDKKNNPKSGQ